MNEQEFLKYIGHFNNAEYDELARYFADDVTLSFPDGMTLEGPDGIVAFYRPVHRDLQEILEIDFLMVSGDHIAVELYTEFHAKVDTANFPGRELKQGDVLRFTSFVHYDLAPDGRFQRIRVARYREHDESYRSARADS